MGLTDKRLGFDELRLARRIGLNTNQIEDAYEVMMQTRKIKTETELQPLRTATDLNQQSITQTVQSWQKGMAGRNWGRFITNPQPALEDSSMIPEEWSSPIPQARTRESGCRLGLKILWSKKAPM